MLEPDDRRHLLEALRPPSGYDLDYAIGTTFSLDLLTLLTTPLAFTLFDQEDSTDNRMADPLALLQAIRTFAERIGIFCEAGQIAIPQASQLLYGYLEDSVYEVKAPNAEGVFHPKVWILRFTKPEVQPYYRLLCMSRNLTFDRSWDTLLVMDGELANRQNAFSANRPLGDFINRLPELTLRPLPSAVRSKIDQIQAEIRRVSFNLPEGFSEYNFWALGIDGAAHWPFKGSYDRVMVVSPFLSKKILTRLADQASDNVLISRLDSLDALDPNCLVSYEQCFVMYDEANVEETDDVAENTLSGLHAKLYIGESGWDSTLWTGSANATDAAFSKNVEFLVELTGKRSQCGIKKFLGSSDAPLSMQSLLKRYSPPDQTTTTDPVQVRLESLADSVRRQLALYRMIGKIHLLEGTGDFEMQLHIQGANSREFTDEVSVSCWPITLGEGSKKQLNAHSNTLAVFNPLSFEALTPFIAFEVVASSGSHHLATRRFVLNITLEGAPPDRRERLLRSLLTSREQVMRFILFLLGFGVSDPTDGSDLDLIRRLISPQSDGTTSLLGFPLFEAMVQALAQDPSRLDSIARLIEDLQKTPEGQQLLPNDFDLIWEPIWAARRGMVR